MERLAECCGSAGQCGRRRSVGCGPKFTGREGTNGLDTEGGVASGACLDGHGLCTHLCPMNRWCAFSWTSTVEILQNRSDNIIPENCKKKMATGKYHSWNFFLHFSKMDSSKKRCMAVSLYIRAGLAIFAKRTKRQYEFFLCISAKLSISIC